jgi:hypothetical protein
MGTTIYDVSPFSVFMSTLLGMAALIGLGVVGVAYAFFNRKDKKNSRIALACAGLFLCTLGALALGFTLLNISTGTQAATVVLNHKQVAKSSCGDNSTCVHYVLETSAGSKSYDFTVEERAFNATNVEGCYRVTYFPNKGFLVSDYGTDRYLATSYVTRIEKMEASNCK